MSDDLIGTTALSSMLAAVFRYRPRSGRTDKENFLTEALVHTLRQSKAAAKTWIKLVTDSAITPATFNISSQVRLRTGSNGHGISDIYVTGKTNRGLSYALLVEHKWDAPVSLAQFRKYAKWLGKKGRRHLGLVYANDRDREKAKKFKPPKGVAFSTTNWEAVYTALARLKSPTGYVSEFLHFLEDMKLTPGAPITKQELLSCVRRRLGRSDPLRRKFRRYCEKLGNQFKWSAIPHLYQETDTPDDYGRCVLRFLRPDYRGPDLTFGFYYDTENHQLDFLNPREGIDIALRLVAAPGQNRDIDDVLQALRRAKPRLERLGATVHIRDEAKFNRYTLFFARMPAARLLHGATTEEAQIDRMHQTMIRWCAALFNDPQVEKLLRKVK